MSKIDCFTLELTIVQINETNKPAGKMEKENRTKHNGTTIKDALVPFGIEPRKRAKRSEGKGKKMNESPFHHGWSTFDAASPGCVLNAALSRVSI